MTKNVCLACHPQWSEFYKKHDCEIKLRQELEAKLQVAVEALEEIRESMNNQSGRQPHEIIYKTIELIKAK